MSVMALPVGAQLNVAPLHPAWMSAPKIMFMVLLTIAQQCAAAWCRWARQTMDANTTQVHLRLPEKTHHTSSSASCMLL